MVTWTVPPMWKGGECFILGGGPSIPHQFGVPEDVIEAVTTRVQKPSAYSPYLEPIHDKHVIGVNNVYQIGRWVGVLFFGDCAWYNVHRPALAEWTGLKVTCCNRFENRKPKTMEGIKYLGKDMNHRQGISSDPTKVSWNNNSGAAAVSLAAHFGAKRIILLGFDMSLNGKGVSHWHGSHGNKKPPSFNRHKLGFPVIAAEAKARNIEILNASPNSTLDMFPKVHIKELL